MNLRIRGPIALEAVTRREMKAFLEVTRSFSSSTTPMATSSENSSALTLCLLTVEVKYAVLPIMQCGETMSAVHLRPRCWPPWPLPARLASLPPSCPSTPSMFLSISIFPLSST